MTFKKGDPGGPGRPKGSQDRYTRIKELIFDVVESRGEELRDVALKDLLSFIGRTAPKEVEVNTPIVIKWKE